VAAELKGAFSVESRLIEGSKGIFDVKVDGRLVYSKHKTHKFPDNGEVTRLIGSA
jgi:selT/selW/selH-like putative selenoprotein